MGVVIRLYEEGKIADLYCFCDMFVFLLYQYQASTLWYIFTTFYNSKKEVRRCSLLMTNC